MNVLARMSLTLGFLALTAGMLWASQELSRVSGWIPRLVLGVTLVLLLAQAWLDWRAGSEPGQPPVDTRRRRREWAAAGWIAGLLGLVWILGVVLGGSMFCLAWLRWHAGERWWVCGLFAGVLGSSLWLVFGLLLGADLYSGLR